MQAVLRESADVRRLIAGWLLLALLALALSTACALLLVAARAPLPNGAAASGTLFRSALVLHVGLAVVVWFLSSAAALWTLASGGAVGVWRKLALALCYGGVLAMVVSLMSGSAVPVLANYVPVLDSPVFLAGLACFFAGIALCGITSARNVLLRLRQPKPEVWRIAVACSMVAAAVAFAALLASLGNAGLPHAASDFEVLAWGPGHLLQFVHVVLLMGVWIVLGERALGKAPASRTLLIVLLSMAAIPTLVAPFIYISYPVSSAAFRHAFTSLMAWGSWPAAAVLGVSLLVQLARAGRGIWHTSTTLPLLLSILLFLLGCALGASIRGESTMVPAHYHGTVGAVTLAYMALGYRLLADFGFVQCDGRLTRWQPAIYGVGLIILASALAWSGWLGVPRKTPHADILVQYPAYFVAMGLVGLGGCLAVSGAGLFVFNIIRVLRGTRQSIVTGVPLRTRWAAVSGVCVVVASGMLTACLPGRDSNSGAQAAPAQKLATSADLAVDSAALHVAQKRKEEIERRFTAAASLLNARQYSAAADELHRVLELAPEMPEAHVNMGFAMIGLQRYAVARDFFQAAIDLRSSQMNAYYGLAVALEGLHDLAGALGAMRTYVHLSKSDDRYLVKANAAIWEWESELQKTRMKTSPQTAAIPENGKNGVAYPIREKKFN